MYIVEYLLVVVVIELGPCGECQLVRVLEKLRDWWRYWPEQLGFFIGLAGGLLFAGPVAHEIP